VELAIQIPLIMTLMFGAVQIARVFYVYHTLQKALRGGAGLLARSTNVAYCDSTDLTMQDVRNFVVYGNLQGQGTPILPDFTPDMIQIFNERISGTIGVMPCSCAADEDTTGDPSCDTSAGGRAPDFIVLNLGNGFPLAVPFPFVNLGTINLKVSVRMPVTGG